MLFALTWLLHINVERRDMLSKQEDIALVAVSCIFLICSLIFNTIGVYHLRLLQDNFTNQRIILLNLSLIEILSAIANLIYWFDGYFAYRNFDDSDGAETKSMTKICSITLGTAWYFYLFYLLSPMMLLIDRFLGVTFPIKYSDIFPKRRAKLMPLTICIVAVIFMLPLLSSNPRNWSRYLQFTALAFEILVLTSAIITYSWIGIKIRNQGNQFGRKNAASRVLKVATLIILTFVCLVVIPEMGLMIATKFYTSSLGIYMRIFHCVTCINYMADPMIYMLGYPPLRSAMRLSIRKSKTILSFSSVKQQSHQPARSTNDSGL